MSPREIFREMQEPTIDNEEVSRFLLNQVDSVPQMEALLLIWETRPREWTSQALAERLYVETEVAKILISPLAQRRLVRVQDSGEKLYSWQSVSEEADHLMEKVARAYRHDLIRATSLIHSKASSGIREFARAFKFKKERE